MPPFSGSEYELIESREIDSVHYIIVLSWDVNKYLYLRRVDGEHTHVYEAGTTKREAQNGFDDFIKVTSETARSRTFPN